MLLVLLLLLALIFLVILISSSSASSTSRGNYTQAPLMYGGNGYYLPPETVGYIITSNSLNNVFPYNGTVTVTYWINPGIDNTWSTNPGNPPYIVKFYPAFGVMNSLLPGGNPVQISVDSEPYPSCNDYQCPVGECECYVFNGQSNGWGYPYFQVTYNLDNYTGPDQFGSDQVAEYIAANSLASVTTIISNNSTPQTYGYPNVIAPIPWSPSLDLF